MFSFFLGGGRRELILFDAYPFHKLPSSSGRGDSMSVAFVVNVCTVQDVYVCTCTCNVQCCSILMCTCVYAYVTCVCVCVCVCVCAHTCYRKKSSPVSTSSKGQMDNTQDISQVQKAS